MIVEQRQTTPPPQKNAFKRQGSTEVRMAHHNNTPNDHKDPNGAAAQPRSQR